VPKAFVPAADWAKRDYTQRATPGLCSTCGRRFGCECALARAPVTRAELEARRPPSPGAEDCCQSSPKCEQCVWTVYDEKMVEYRALQAAFEAGVHRSVDSVASPCRVDRVASDVEGS
jgi:hypothetical protein